MSLHATARVRTKICYYRLLLLLLLLSLIFLLLAAALTWSVVATQRRKKPKKFAVIKDGNLFLFQYAQKSTAYFKHCEIHLVFRGLHTLGCVS